MLRAVSFWTVLLFLTLSARADTLFNSFGPGGSFTTSFGWGIGGPFEMAYPFVAAETATFDAASLAIASGPINIQRSVNIALMTDALDRPGRVIESFQLVDVLPFAGSVSIAPPIVVNSLDHPLLQANTRYWLSIANPGNSGEIDWGTAGIGPPFQRAIRQLGPNQQWLVSGSDRSTAGAFSVTGTPVSSTPVSPSSGTGAVRTFTGNYVAANLQWVAMLFAVATNGGNQAFCYVHYDVGGGGFWLYDDVAGYFKGPISPGTPSNQLQGSLCALNTSGSSVSGFDKLLTVNASVVFKFPQSLNIYMRAYSVNGVDTGWVQEGTWTTAAASMGTMTVAPSSGNVASGTPQTFTLTYPDPQGFAEAAFGWEQFLVGAAADGGGQPFCFVHYDRAGNGLWMYSSDVGFFLGPVAPGTASSALDSSACSVNTAGATVTNTGGNLVLTVPVTMKAPMVGAKNTFQRRLDALNRDTGFVQTGTWTIQ